MLYSSIVYGLLRDGAVCSGLPVEPAPNAPCAAFLMSPEGVKKAEKAKREYIEKERKEKKVGKYIKK
jgi:hypothetical protein